MPGKLSKWVQQICKTYLDGFPHEFKFQFVGKSVQCVNINFVRPQKPVIKHILICICIGNFPTHEYNFVEIKKTDKMRKQKFDKAKLFIR